MIRDEMILQRVRHHVLVAMQELDYDDSIEQISKKLGVDPDIVQVLLAAPRWDSTFAYTAMSVLGVTIPIYETDTRVRVKYTDEEFDRVVRCLDCNVHTKKIGEYYCLQKDVWYSVTAEHGGTGMLCLGCLEERLGRILTSDDFVPGIPINENDDHVRRSDRFLNRLSKTKKTA
jgi:hypothetical protein